MRPLKRGLDLTPLNLRLFAELKALSGRRQEGHYLGHLGEGDDSSDHA